MNVKPGGMQPKMRPGWYMMEGEKVEQSMVFEGGPHEGLAKGLRQVCLERFGEDRIKGQSNISRFRNMCNTNVFIFCQKYFYTYLFT